MTSAEKQQAVAVIYKTADENLRELLANIQPAPHCNGALSAIIENVKQDLIYLKNIALQKTTDQ